MSVDRMRSNDAIIKETDNNCARISIKVKHAL